MTTLSETARAKVNLTLRVLGRRTDGYHDLESLVAFADCADTLSLEPGPTLELVTCGPRALECGEGGDNLVIKAAQALCDEIAGLTLGRFTLDKQLPVAAGIGGGSADAAAALRLLARANAISLDDPRLAAVARLTGADIPVCVASHPCIMTGVGETLTPLTVPRLPCVLVNPRVAVATRDVFDALGLKKGELRVGVTDVVRAVEWPAANAPQDEWLTALEKGTNDLETPALQIEPMIGEVLAALRAAQGVQFARMSGSGATCFAIFVNGADARDAARTIVDNHPRWWVHAGVLS